MGLLGSAQQFASTVLITVKSNTDDAKRGLKSLSAEEKKLEAQRIAAAEKENARMDKHIKRIAMVGAAVAGAAVTVAVASKGLDAYAKTSTNAAKEVERMKETASKAMDTISIAIGKAAIALEPLIDGFSGIIGLLSKMELIAPLAIGAISLAINANPKVAALLATAAWAMSMAGSGSASAVVSRARNPNATGDFLVAERDAAAKRAGMRGDFGGTFGGTDESGSVTAAAGDAVAALYSGINALNRLAKGDPWNERKAKVKGKPRAARFSDFAEDPFTDYTDFGAGVGRGNLGASADSVSRDMYGREVALDTQGPLTERLTSDWFKKIGEMKGKSEKADSFLSKTFGPVDEFSGYAAAFDMLSGAVGSAMTAWIDGSASAGEAFKAFVAESVKGIAIQMAMESLKHGAYAIGRLAIGDAAGAGLHAKSAGMFAAGAAVAAAAAKGLGGSGGATAGGAGVGAPVPTGNQQIGGGGVTNIIGFGDSFADDSQRYRQLKAKKMVGKVLGRSGVEYR